MGCTSIARFIYSKLTGKNWAENAANELGILLGLPDDARGTDEQGLLGSDGSLSSARMPG
jgi:hypothetical protein